MNFDEIENLSEENVNELFENIDYLTGTYFYTQLCSCTRWYLDKDNARMCDHNCCVNYYSPYQMLYNRYISYCYSDGCRDVGVHWANYYGNRHINSALLYR